jgi:RNA polymerase sigma-70 factor (ECF subfamily)
MGRGRFLETVPARRVFLVSAMSLEGQSSLYDDELVKLCQARGARDDRPFQELLHRYQAAIWRVCYSFTNNSQDAEDLTQEVFFKVYRRLEQFEGRASFKSWLYRIAINTSKNEIRRRSSRPRPIEIELETAAEKVAGPASVEEEAQRRQQSRQLALALAQLSPEEHEVWHLKDVEQHPYEEIAQRLGIGVSAAKMRVLRARQVIQSAYAQLETME